MDKQTIRAEIISTDQLLRAAQKKLEDHVRRLPVIFETRLGSIQVSYDVFRVGTIAEAKVKLKKINELNYCGKNDWRIPNFAECYLLREEKFNWYELDKTAEFFVGDHTDRAFCSDGIPGWINHAPANKVFRVFFVRVMRSITPS